MPRLISKEKAYQLTTHWGSYMNSWDPGACMYGFGVGDGRPQSEAHRKQCLDYLQGMIDDPKYRWPVSHLRELKSLRHWFRHCEVLPPEEYIHDDE
jgi:hypothetical protein